MQAATTRAAVEVGMLISTEATPMVILADISRLGEPPKSSLCGTETLQNSITILAFGRVGGVGGDRLSRRVKPKVESRTTKNQSCTNPSLQESQRALCVKNERRSLAGSCEYLPRAVAFYRPCR